MTGEASVQGCETLYDRARRIVDEAERNGYSFILIHTPIDDEGDRVVRVLSQLTTSELACAMLDLGRQLQRSIN